MRVRRHDVTIASPQLREPFDMTSTPALAGFAVVYERHYEAVFRAALRVIGNPADAEDVLQTVFLRLLSQSEQEEAAGRPAAYFRRAAVNAAVDLLRRRTVHAETAYDDRAPHAAIDPALSGDPSAPPAHSRARQRARDRHPNARAVRRRGPGGAVSGWPASCRWRWRCGPGAGRAAGSATTPSR